jgi:hypothetical protein
MALKERLTTKKSFSEFSIEYNIFDGKVKVDIVAGAKIPAALIGECVSCAIADWGKSAIAAHTSRKNPWRVEKTINDKSITYRLIEKIDDGTKVSSSIKVVQGSLVGFSVQLKDLFPIVQEILHDWKVEFSEPGELY